MTFNVFKILKFSLLNKALKERGHFWFANPDNPAITIRASERNFSKGEQFPPSPSLSPPSHPRLTPLISQGIFIYFSAPTPNNFPGFSIKTGKALLAQGQYTDWTPTGQLGLVTLCFIIRICTGGRESMSNVIFLCHNVKVMWKIY